MTNKQFKELHHGTLKNPKVTPFGGGLVVARAGNNHSIFYPEEKYHHDKSKLNEKNYTKTKVEGGYRFDYLGKEVQGATLENSLFFLKNPAGNLPRRIP